VSLYRSRHKTYYIKQKEVRTHLNTILGDNFLQAPMVTPEQSGMYTVVWNVDGGQTCAPCCTVDNFKIDLLGPPRCAWNLSAGRIFCRSFLDFHDLADDPDLIGAVSSAFFTRIRTLKIKYDESLCQAHARQELARRKRCYHRKYFVCRVDNSVLYVKFP
jgi:hypothetical protein